MIMQKALSFYGVHSNPYVVNVVKKIAYKFHILN